MNTKCLVHVYCDWKDAAVHSHNIPTFKRGKKQRWGCFCPDFDPSWPRMASAWLSYYLWSGVCWEWICPDNRLRKQSGMTILNIKLWRGTDCSQSKRELFEEQGSGCKNVLPPEFSPVFFLKIISGFFRFKRSQDHHRSLFLYALVYVACCVFWLLLRCFFFFLLSDHVRSHKISGSEDKILSALGQHLDVCGVLHFDYRSTPHTLPSKLFNAWFFIFMWGGLKLIEKKPLKI